MKGSKWSLYRSMRNKSKASKVHELKWTKAKRTGTKMEVLKVREPK